MSNEEALEHTLEAIKETGAMVRAIDQALDGLEDMGMKLPLREYQYLERQVATMQANTSMFKSPHLRDFYRELFSPLTARLPKFNPRPIHAS